ncbi:hypothetical protein HispidOSU_024778, partial [Sigmodon hispidus]
FCSKLKTVFLCSHPLMVCLSRTSINSNCHYSYVVSLPLEHLHSNEKGKCL